MKVTFKNYNFNTINFNGRDEIQESAKKFAADLFIAASEERPDFKKVEQLADKYVPGIKVCTYKPRKNEPNTYAVCTNDYEFRGKTIDRASSDIKLMLSKLDASYPYDELEYYLSIIHEMTHALQYSDKDFSFINLYNNFLQRHSRNDFRRNEFILQRRLSPDKYILAAFKKLDLDNHKCLNANRAISEDKAKTLLPNRDEIQNLFEEQINKDIFRLKKSGIKFNWKFLQQVILNDAMAEQDAYSNEKEIFCKYTNEADLSSLLYIHLYKILADTITKIKA